MLTDQEIEDLAGELVQNGWAQCEMLRGVAKQVHERLRDEHGIQAGFIDGSYDFWVVRGTWTTDHPDDWYNFGKARALNPKATPEMSGIERRLVSDEEE